MNDIQKKMPVRNTSIEKKLNIIRDIFCLNKDEMAIIEFCLLRKLNNVFMELFTSIKGEEMATFTKNVLGMRQCRMFFFDKILQLSSPKMSIPDSLNFGSAVHKACENAVKSAQDEGKFWESEIFVEEVKKQIDKFAFSSFVQREQYKTIAETTIKEFYEKDLSLTDISTIYNVENDIITEFEGVMFKGLPDRINLVNGKFRIFDYKTGRAKDEKEICLTTIEDDSLGGHEDYYIQMGLYKYFLEKTTGKKVETTTFVFPQEFRKPCVVEYTDEDIEKILDKYRNAIKGIQEQNFAPTPSKNSCAFCPYQNDLCVCNQ